MASMKDGLVFSGQKKLDNDNWFEQLHIFGALTFINIIYSMLL